MIVVHVTLCSWAIVYFFMGDWFVEKASDLVTFISASNETFKRTFVHLSLSFSDEQRVKIRNSMLYTIPRSSPGRWAECGGGGGGGGVKM